MKKILSIIIVSYKNLAQAQALKRQLAKEKQWECVVVDNTTHNRGYGKACNEGAQKTHGKYLFFLNADVEMTVPAVRKMIAYMEKHKNVGVIGPQFLNAEKRIEQSSTALPTPSTAAITLSFINKVFPNNPISKRYWLKTWDRQTTREVDVVSGAAMLLRRSDFESVGGFDERFFLYWEEFDLCARIKQLGKRVVFLADAQAYHPRQVSIHLARREGVNTHHYFTQSRFRYFKKHFGMMKASLLEAWFTVTEHWRFFLLIALSVFLRTYDLFHIRLIGDVGRDYLRALSLLRFQSFDLLGIPSSIPRFSQGPFNIWFDALSFLFGGVSVFAPPLLAAVLTSAGVGLLYILLEKYTGKTPAFAGALLYAASPVAVLQSRMPFYLFAVPVFLAIFLYVLRLVEKYPTPKQIFFTIFTFGLLFQWELAVIPVGAALLLYILNRWKIWRPHIAHAVLGGIVGFLPQILFDVFHKCSQLCGLVAWAGYRVFATTGFDSRHGLSSEMIGTTLSGMFHQFQRLIGWNEWYSFLGIAALAGYGALSARKKHTDHMYGFLLFSTVFLFAAIIMQGFASEAYFPPFIIFLAFFAAMGIKHMSFVLRKVIVAAIVLLAVKNSALLISSNFFSPNVLNTIEASRWIVHSANNTPIVLRSYDAGSAFPTYVDHYKFLILAMNGKLGETGTIYIISEQPGVALPSVDVEKRFFGEATVIRNLSSNLIR